MCMLNYNTAFGLWINHLPPVQWFTFGSVFFLKWQLVCKFGIVERIVLHFFVFVCLYITQVLPLSFPLSIFLLWNNFLYQVLCTTILYKHSLDSFLLKVSTELQNVYKQVSQQQWCWCSVIISVSLASHSPGYIITFHSLYMAYEYTIPTSHFCHYTDVSIVIPFIPYQCHPNNCHKASAYTFIKRWHGHDKCFQFVTTDYSPKVH